MSRLLLIVLCCLCATATAQEYRQVTEYVTVQRKICENGRCRIVNVREPVTRLVKVAAESTACVVSTLADVASVPVRAVANYVDRPGYHRHILTDGTVIEHHDSNYGSASAHAGVMSWGGMTWPKYRGPVAPGMLATVPTAESLDVSQFVDYASIQRVTGLRLLDRWRERRNMRRQGRLTNMAVFARTGINRRIQALANFMPRAWFNLR